MGKSKSFNRLCVNIISFIWQLPQHILFFILSIFIKHDLYVIYKGKRIYKIKTKFFSGVSLGNYIFLNENYFANYISTSQTIRHEYGHSIQSLILGPLYLFLVGIPSLCLNILSRFNSKIYNNYYKVYPENWADTLGDAQR